jgi:hypothetical protein
MKRLSMQLVSLVLLLGLSSFCANIGTHYEALSASQHATFHANPLLGNGSPNSTGILADGGDPGAPPMPLPRPRFLADGGDPGAPPMPLPRPRFLADGGDPGAPPMPLPGPRHLA